MRRKTSTESDHNTLASLISREIVISEKILKIQVIFKIYIFNFSIL